MCRIHKNYDKILLNELITLFHDIIFEGCKFSLYGTRTKPPTPCTRMRQDDSSLVSWVWRKKRNMTEREVFNLGTRKFHFCAIVPSLKK